MNLENNCVYEDAGKMVGISYITCLEIAMWLLVLMLFIDIILSFWIQRTTYLVV